MLAALRSLLRTVRKRRFSYAPLIEIRIFRDAILHNLKAAREASRKPVAPVLKSNAYGHGLVEVARILDDQGVPFVCVDSYFEALILRNEGIRTPIFTLGYTPVETIKQSSLPDVSFGVISLEGLRALAEARARATIHLKIDTGMHRHGVMPSEIDDAITLLRSTPQIILEGIYSHLADADVPHSAHAKKQIDTWNSAVQKIKTVFPELKYWHCAATSATERDDIDANCVRFGLGLYGMNAGGNLPLRPALEMRTIITSIRTLLRGESVGYNATFTAERDIQIATIPVGYYEGLDRRLSNKGFVLVRGIPCPIIGRVSMNIASIDVSAIPDPKEGEPSIVISADSSALNSVESMANLSETIPYEILVHIPAHLRRVVV